MPQIMPMSWLLMFSLFMLSILMLSSILYFSPQKMETPKNKKEKSNQTFFMWY